MFKSEIVAYHGWGFQNKFWDAWNDLFSEHVNFKAADRGYYENPEQFGFSGEAVERKIVFAHSFGLHWCPDEILKGADHLVIFGGFLDFHPENEKQRKRSFLIVQQMLSHFVEKPHEVLQKFVENVFYPQKPERIDLRHKIDHEILLSDLTRIQHQRISEQLLHQIPEISIIHGENDKIVSNQKGRELYQKLRYRSQYFEIKKAGHAVPFTHYKKCYALLKPFIEPRYFPN